MLRPFLFLSVPLLAILPCIPGSDGAQKKAAGLADLATPIERMRVHKDFKVELLHSVPRKEQGSWVNMTVDPKGRLIVSDQYGKLYRITPPAIGGKASDTKIEQLNVEIGRAHGLCWAFNSLYVVVSENGNPGPGLYRVTSSQKNDQFDTVKLLRKLEGAGEHGPHAVLPHPNGKSLVVVGGNHTRLTPVHTSRVPMNWAEDHILPRMWDANGHARGILAPGGWICSTDPDGTSWELLSIGYRNCFDVAFSPSGELFTYDSDMEWDMNTPWYRPTRVCHVVSGSEFGWRSGSGKWPVYYPDNLPAVVNIGPGSPTGMVFGTGARFPVRYQEALFICDWSYGKLYAVHLKPEGASYTGDAEEIVSGTPLPLTDVVVNPMDGALYFTIGGRRTQSGFYRLTYVGTDNVAPARGDPTGRETRTLRHQLERFHAKKDDNAVPTAWPHLGNADRFIRYAARIAVEHQDVKLWQDKALEEKQPQASLTALLALSRCGSKELQPRMLESLGRFEWGKLKEDQKLELLRVYGLTFLRMGKPEAKVASEVIARLDPHFPAKSRDLNQELSQLLIYLEAPGVAKKTLALRDKAITQEEQMAYVASLRALSKGWTMPERESYFKWFLKAGSYKGGNSFGGFVKVIKNDAVATLTPDEFKTLKPILEAKPIEAPLIVGKPRPFVKKWSVKELLPVVENGLVKRDFDRGRQLFAETRCFSCHRFDNEGGAAGPDLTSVAGRFSHRDLLESIIEPSKVIGDQYAAVVIETNKGLVVTGRIVNLNTDKLMINTDMLNPNGIVHVSRKDIESLKPSPLSMMPEGLIDTLHQDEVLDLMAYLLSRGKRDEKMFKE